MERGEWKRDWEETCKEEKAILRFGRNTRRGKEKERILRFDLNDITSILIPISFFDYAGQSFIYRIMMK